jgi:L-alanine-DL-glutamate epimerase-like enolase superfamily enzyme
MVDVTKIVDVETFCIQLKPRRHAVMRGQPTMTERRMLVVLRTDDGLTGWGEATAQAIWGGMHGRYFGETMETVEHVIHDLLSPALLGSDPRSPAPIVRDMDQRLIGHPWAKAAVEMAIQDIRGKALGEPIVTLLGGRQRAGTRIAHMIGIMSDEEALEEAEGAVRVDGITAFQVKGGEDPARDARLIEKLRGMLPDTTFLRVDANQGYGRQPKAAAVAVRRVETAGANAIEQPGSTAEALAACREAVSIPVIADEGCWNAADLLELWSRGAVDAVSIYVAKAGGIAQAASLAQLAHEVGFSCDLNGSLETGIGTAASLHVAESAASASLASVVPIPMGLTRYAGNYFSDDVVTAGFTYDAGVLYLSDAPGLGVTVDEEKVRALTCDSGHRRSS